MSASAGSDPVRPAYESVVSIQERRGALEADRPELVRVETEVREDGRGDLGRVQRHDLTGSTSFWPTLTAWKFISKMAGTGADRPSSK